MSSAEQPIHAECDSGRGGGGGVGGGGAEGAVAVVRGAAVLPWPVLNVRMRASVRVGVRVTVRGVAGSV